MKKLTVSEFREKRKQLQAIIDEWTKYDEENQKAPYEEYRQKQDEIKERYSDIVISLSIYDLSDIPFEEWEGFVFPTSDFKDTKANLDFEIIDLDSEVYDFRGCNIKNLDKAKNLRRLRPESFDEEVIKNNPNVFLSNIFDDEIKEAYYKNNLTIEILATLTDEQLNELGSKVNLLSHFNVLNETAFMIEILGIDKTVQLCKRSKEEFEAVCDILNEYRYYYPKDELLEELKNTEVDKIKQLCFDSMRNKIINGESHIFSVDYYSELFVKENSDIFLINAVIPEEVKKDFFMSHLTITELIEYEEVFKNIPIDNFMSDYRYEIFNLFKEKLGIGELQKLIFKHKDVIKHIEENGDFPTFSKCVSHFVDDVEDIEKVFLLAVKEYIIKSCDYDSLINEPEKYSWFKSMDIKIIDEIKTTEELLEYDDGTILGKKSQEAAIILLGIENIKRLEKETGMFSHRTFAYDQGLFASIAYHVNLSGPSKLRRLTSIFQDGKLPYEEFVKKMPELLNLMRLRRVFTVYSDYRWLEDIYGQEHPEMFIDKTAPKELVKAFYSNSITPMMIFNNPEYIPFLLDKNLQDELNASISFSYAQPAVDEENLFFVTETYFIPSYTKRYGNEKFLNLCTKYGPFLSDLSVSCTDIDINDEKQVNKALRDAIYKKIIKESKNKHYLNDKKIIHSFLKEDKDFASEHPDLFIDLSTISEISEEDRLMLTMAFYEGTLTAADIRKFPQIAKTLEEKELSICFSNSESKDVMETLVSNFGKSEALKLCAKYGSYLDGLDIVFADFLPPESVEERIMKAISYRCKEGLMSYSPETAPEFLKEEHPELFLSDDAPELLKRVFYTRLRTTSPFIKLQQNKDEWMPYLEEKDLFPLIARSSTNPLVLKEFIELFGKEKGIKLGINRAETVTKMLSSDKVKVMFQWYKKTGEKFIPDCVVMENFDIEEADKFLKAGSNWSSLMRIKSFSAAYESRDAMLKLAYSFGVFDQDPRGLKKLIELLTDVPRTLSKEQSHIFKSLEAVEEDFDLRKECENLKKTLILEGLKLYHNIPIFEQLYRKNPDESYTLIINSQSFPKSTQIMRSILNSVSSSVILTPYRAHQLFGGFDLKYDPDFREFLLKNIDKILTTPEYGSFISNIQKQFSEIKAINSNRTLTLDLAISYVQSNKYSDVQVGNERVAEVSSIAGYSQEDFDVLQQIYNYGRQRTFSSIPRIEKKIEKVSGIYTYEILRVDDPLAMVIGTLTDCCQELGNCAELCMEHSMVSKDGRVFVIKDEQGNIVAQSWVWRNKDVLCFDNIEIPAKAFDRVEKLFPNLGRKGFTDEIFEVYKKAAQDLIEKDEQVYKELLDSGKITQEQYDGLRLGKVTAGLGYNDIAASLEANAKMDNEALSRPLEFNEPVKLDRGLYTSDSLNQYVLEERKDRKKYEGDTPSVHSDSYIEYDDSNFSEKSLLTLQRLETIVKGNRGYLYTNLYDETENIVSEIARNYDLNPKTTKIIMNPNFAIIYDVNDDELRIADLLYVTEVDNEKINIEDNVVMQIKLALDQIIGAKKVNLEELDDKQKEMYEKAISLVEEIDVERGVSHAK